MNLRTYLTDKIGDLGVTLIGGIIVSIVCPLMFIVGNLFLAIGLNFTSFLKGEIRSTVKHIISELILQTVIISDSSKLEKNGTNGFTWWKIPKLALSFMVYLLPTVAILSVISFGQTNKTLCRPMKAEFLFNNSFVPAFNMDFDTLYRQRQIYGELHEIKWYQWPDVMELNGQMVWNAKEQEGYSVITPRYHKYLNFSSLDNLIDQFNFLGYHDVCNYPKSSELHFFRNRKKEFQYLYPGYSQRSSSGPNYIPI